MYQVLKKAKDNSGKYRVIFIAALLLSFHYYLITYINSTFIKQSTGIDLVGILYALGSVLNIVLFLKAPSLIRKYGNLNFIKVISLIEILALLSMALSKNVPVIIFAFIVHHSINAIILSCLDMYLEDTSDTKTMGKTRGTFLTIISIAAVISPLAIGSLVKNGDFSKIYFFSVFFMLIFLWWVTQNFKRDPITQFKEVNILSELKEFLRNKKVKSVTICYALLQFFFSWMIIYVPLYLVESAGFNWSETALIISISLLPFLLFQIPIGEMADKKLDEREIIVGGFMLTTFALLFFPFIPAGHFVFWTIALFLARTGASVIETATESYFFRGIKGKDELIEVFRISSPFAFIVGPLVGSVLLIFLPFKTIFLVLSAIMFSGIYFGAKISKD